MPDANRFVLAGSHDVVTLPIPLSASDHPGMRQDPESIGSFAIPDANGVVPTGCHQLVSIRTDRDTEHFIGMRGQHGQQPSASGVPESKGPINACGDNLAAIRSKLDIIDGMFLKPHL